MTLEEGIEAVKKCMKESKKRFVANLQSFHLLVIDKDGTRALGDFDA